MAESGFQTSDIDDSDVVDIVGISKHTPDHQ